MVFAWSVKVHKIRKLIKCAHSSFRLTNLLLKRSDYSGDLKSDHSKIQKHFESWCSEDWISKGPVFKGLGYGFSYCSGSKHLKTGPFEIERFLLRFQMVFDKMAVICPHFKWLGFRISDPFEIRTIFRPTSVWPFEIRTRSPLIKSCK